MVYSIGTKKLLAAAYLLKSFSVMLFRFSLVSFFALILAGCATATKDELAAEGVSRDGAATVFRAAARSFPRGVSPAVAFAEFGYPVAKRVNLTLLENQGYTVGFYEDYAVPLWACYYCDDCPGPDFDRPSGFEVDARTAVRLEDKDYIVRPGKVEYERGHMAPNKAIATRYGKAAQLETFKMSNVVPQLGAINGGIWRILEGRIEKDYAKLEHGCWVTVGPVFQSDKPDWYNGKAAIPDAFFCIVIKRDSAGKYSKLAYIIPHNIGTGRKATEFSATIDEIEAATGLDFNAKLPDSQERELEAAPNASEEFGEIKRHR